MVSYNEQSFIIPKMIFTKKMMEMLNRAHGAKTVTLDNDGEFAMHTLVSKAINADIYFLKPHSLGLTVSRTIIGGKAMISPALNSQGPEKGRAVLWRVKFMGSTIVLYIF
nr:hypothetical protein [Kistimonas asteriae]